MNIEEAKLVLVLWEDAEASPAWVNKDTIENYTLPVCYTVGWLVHETDKHITLAQTVGSKIVKEDDQDAPGNIWHIPKGMIVSIKPIKLPKIKGL